MALQLSERIPGEILAGAPSPRSGLMWRSDDGLLESGVFEADPGVFTFTFGWEEFFVVVAGRATVEFGTGQVMELAPGVAGAFCPGDETTWTIHETFRKGFHCDHRDV